MKISAVIIWHGHAEELTPCLGALAPQMDEVAVAVNIPGSVDELPPETIVVHDKQLLGFAANAYRGFAATPGEALVLANPDTLARRVRCHLRSFLEGHPRCGMDGPTLLYLYTFAAMDLFDKPVFTSVS